MFLRAGPLAVILAGLVCVSTSAAKEPPRPYRVMVLAAYGEPLGPESLRDDLERELVERLDGDRCFESVVRSTSDAAAEADLIFEVILDRYLEETQYDVTIATQNRPGEQGSNLQWSAGIEAMVHLQVRRAADRAVVTMKRKRESVNRRAQPVEDTRFEARVTLVESIVHEVRSYVCKVSPGKWEKQIRQARPATPSD